MDSDAYSKAGVDIDLEAVAVKALVSELTYRRTGEYQMLTDIGHFAGFISFGEYVLAMAVDGVGTKMMVADELSDWSTVGIDCIAMNVNDLYVMNLEPVAFVDYVASSLLSPKQMKQIGKGLNAGAKLANLSILGGETATLKGLVTGLDLAGSCLGIQKKQMIIDGSSIVPGDCIVGIPSSGIHSNGLTLARKVVEDHGSYDLKLSSGETIGDLLLKPTRIYHETLMVCRDTDVHGMCHITGGGLLNLKRLGSYGYAIGDPIIPHEIFSWIEKEGKVSLEDMYKTFNMGMGYVFILPEDGFSVVHKYFNDAKIVGRVTENPEISLRSRVLF